MDGKNDRGAYGKSGNITEGEMEFSGESIVVDANGEVLKKADDSEQILYVDIEPENVISIRKKRSYTDLRRPELYH